MKHLNAILAGFLLYFVVVFIGKNADADKTAYAIECPAFLSALEHALSEAIAAQEAR